MALRALGVTDAPPVVSLLLGVVRLMFTALLASKSHIDPNQLIPSSSRPRRFLDCLERSRTQRRNRDIRPSFCCWIVATGVTFAINCYMYLSHHSLSVRRCREKRGTPSKRLRRRPLLVPRTSRGARHDRGRYVSLLQQQPIAHHRIRARPSGTF